MGTNQYQRKFINTSTYKMAETFTGLKETFLESLGIHILAEFYDCDHEILKNKEEIELFLNEAAIKAGATVVNSVFHRFNPHGISGVVVIAESHLTVHTWPEHGYAAVDIFTCGESLSPLEACEYLKDQMGCGHYSTMEIKRGQVPVVNQRNKTEILKRA